MDRKFTSAVEDDPIIMQSRYEVLYDLAFKITL